MAKQSQNAFKAGLFIVFALLLGVAMLVGIRGVGNFMSPMKKYTVAFELTENLGGLKIGDTVRVGGFDQGRVTDVRFVEATSDRATHFEADFTLPAKYVVHRDAVVQIEQGLTGTANLNISGLGAGDAYTSGYKLDGVGSALGDFYAIAPEAKALVADVRSKVAPAYDSYARVANRAEAALNTGNEAMANVRDLLGDAKTDFRGTIANLHASTGTIKERLPETIARVDKFLDTTTETVAGTRGTLEDIRESAANTKDVTSEARALLVRNRSRFDAIIAALGTTSSNLEGASVEIRRSPWRLLYQPKTEELSNLNVFDSARQFAEAAQELNGAASAVRDAMKDPTMKAPQMAELMKTLDASFERYKIVETKLWNAVK